MFVALFLLSLPLFLQMCPHYRVEVTVRLGSSSHGGLRRAIVLFDGLLYGLGDAFYALDVSLALLQKEQSILQTYP